MSDELNNIELIVEDFEQKLFEEIDRLRKPPVEESLNRKSQVHFYVPTERYKKLRMLGVNKEMTIGEMFNEMLIGYLERNKDY